MEHTLEFECLTYFIKNSSCSRFGVCMGAAFPAKKRFGAHYVLNVCRFVHVRTHVRLTTQPKKRVLTKQVGVDSCLFPERTFLPLAVLLEVHCGLVEEFSHSVEALHLIRTQDA